MNCIKTMSVVTLASALLLVSVPFTSFATESVGGTITIENTLVNDNGGKSSVDGFSVTLQRLEGGEWLDVETDTLTSGSVIIPVEDGQYHLLEVSDEDHDGYAVSYVGCDSISISAETPNATCTITNNDIAPKLTLETVVVGGSASASDWTLTASRTSPSPLTLSGVSGVTSDSIFQAGTYSFSQSGPSGYTAGDWSCTLDNPNGLTVFADQKLTLEAGDESTCTVTNTFVGGGDTGTTTDATSTPPTDGGSDGSSGDTTTHHFHHSGGGGSSSNGEVLGASTDACVPLISNFLGRGYANASADVMKLQTFLNSNLGLTLAVDGVFGSVTESAVKTFQEKYWQEVLKPWFVIPGSGIRDENDSTGIVYKTTLHEINDLNCGTETALPVLP